VTNDVLLLCATAGEATGVVDQLRGRADERQGSKVTHVGRVVDVACRLAVTGIAATNTAQTLTREIERSRPRLVLQFGIGGAYPRGGLRVGDLAVASEEHYGDVGVQTPDEWLGMQDVGFPLLDTDPPIHNRVPMDQGLATRAADAVGASVGPFVTVNRCSGVGSLGDVLYERTLGICESMEGAAAAHVCTQYELPCLEVRAASNMVEDRDRSRWRIGDAIAAVTAATLTILSHLDRIEGPS